MPHYRINIKLENEPVKEYLISDDRKFLDVVYSDYKRRVQEKNGAGRVIYFDLVMVAEESLEHLEDRTEVFNQENEYGITHHERARKNRKAYNDRPTLGQRNKPL